MHVVVFSVVPCQCVAPSEDDKYAASMCNMNFCFSPETGFMFQMRMRTLVSMYVAGSGSTRVWEHLCLTPPLTCLYSSLSSEPAR